MVVTNRQQVIFLEILKNDFISIKNLSLNLKITDKTITKEIDRLNEFFNSFDTVINVSYKNGISIDSIYSNSELYDIIKSNQKLSLEDEFLLIVLFATKPLSSSVLADKIYTSRQTVDNLFKENCDEFLFLKTKEGLVFNGDYVKRVIFIIKVLSFYVDISNYKSTFKSILRNINVDINSEHFKFDIEDKIPIKEISLYKDRSIKDFYLSIVLSSYFNVCNDFTFLLEKREVKNIDYDDELKKIYDVCSKKLNNIIDMKDDELFPLVNHIDTIIKNASKYNQTDTYIYLKQLKKFTSKYRLSVMLAEGILSEIKEEFNSEVEFIEVYFVAIHIQALFEKRKRYSKKKVLLICEYGLGISNFLMAKLENEIKLNVEYKSISLNEYVFNKKAYESYDLIITTVINFKDHENVIYVSTILSDKEILKIEEKILEEENNNVLNKVLPNKNIVIGSNYIFIEEVFDYLSDVLKDKVGEGFLESLKNRTDSLDVSSGIAFLHGDPKFVKENICFIIVNDKDILLNDTKVKYFIVNVWNELFIKENINFVKWYYRKLSDKSLIEKYIKEDYVKKRKCMD